MRRLHRQDRRLLLLNELRAQARLELQHSRTVAAFTTTRFPAATSTFLWSRQRWFSILKHDVVPHDATNTISMHSTT